MGHSKLTKASLKCQKVGFISTLTEEGRAAKRVKAILKQIKKKKYDVNVEEK